MDTFHWDKHFETGLEEVDKQHRELVNLINRLGDQIALKESSSFSQIEKVFDELVAYTLYHFGEEEKLMQETGMDTHAAALHVRNHAEFLQVVTKMHAGISPQNPDAATPMLRYLVHWLAFHILGVDQSMARQILAIQAGQKPADAFLEETHIAKAVTQPLLVALNGLFQQVSEQNRALIELNQSLELKVMERTRELTEANQQWEEMALTDVLTGLPNRRHAMARLNKEWAELGKSGNPLSCMMIDADGFKQINDNYGHDAGDEVLRQLARQLRYAVRTDDVVCRLGGDEFLIICANTPHEGAMHVAELMRQAIASLRVPAGSGEWKGSVSVGVATRHREMSTPEDLIKAADECVYRAKRNGRNCVAGSAHMPPDS